MAALQMKDIDLKRCCLSVVRLKRKNKTRESLALGKDSGNGWYMVYAEDLPVVYITGEYCDKIETFQVASIEARYECPPCVDIAGCKPTP